MSYKDAYHPNVKSDLKNLDKSVTRQIHHVYIEAILLNPFAHEKLR
jgi:mRNA-degrading endonuclease RelE of RelBE toxin-antitoxin system